MEYLTKTANFDGLRGHFLAEEIRRYVSKIRSKHIINSSLNISLYTIMMRLKCLSMAPINLCQFFPMVIGLLFHLFITLYAATSNLGPERPATQGSIWPKPRFEKRFQFYFTIDTNQLQFQIVGETCSIIDRALERYAVLAKSTVMYGKIDSTRRGVKSAPELNTKNLTTFRINLKKPCEEYPTEKMDESYQLTVAHHSLNDMPEDNLSADSVWGILRGLESFSQMLVPHKEGRVFILQGVLIEDSPRFPYRGLLLDTSRHFFPVPEILRVLDGMAYSKMNIFHWHIVDDQSFPYRSILFPELSAKGAYQSELAVYTPCDVLAIIDYARDRGIRVIPEFDVPGHARSWGEGVDGLLTRCSSTNEYGPMDPTKTETYVFLRDFFAEIASVFKDKYVHLGGDELNTRCWEDNKLIADFMAKSNDSQDITSLKRLFYQRVLDINNKLGLKSMFWEEILETGLPLNKDTVIQVWKVESTYTIQPVVSRGFKAVYSGCWYLNMLERKWHDYYKCDILEFNGTPRQKSLVVGGEVSVWGEWVDESNLSPHIWPRACAAAERLWTYTPDSEAAAGARIEEHACRLKRRGVPAAPPNGPGYCPVIPLAEDTGASTREVDAETQTRKVDAETQTREVDTETQTRETPKPQAPTKAPSDVSKPESEGSFVESLFEFFSYFRFLRASN